MLQLMLIKLLATAGIVILVALSVGRLGPRLGGILAGTPVILGPGYFFMLREQAAGFVQDAVLFTLHALVATLLFTVCFVMTATRLSALRSLALASLLWVPGALLFTQIPGGLLAAIAAYLVVLLVAEGVNRWQQLGQPVVVASSGWLDLLLRGLLAGAVVSLATTLAARSGPELSGVILGFPVGILTIAWALHERYGAEVARMTVSMTQRGMLSLLAFCAVSYLGVGHLPGMLVFTLSLAASMTTSFLLFMFSLWRARRLYPRSSA
ncbi:hypothetical protein [Halomonas korlensis]|uniref:Uncharacterized protein n=1 Tax=Halomonas korlensis TaxID=463301 RepID=A0A1I7JSY8_9GAMM|nr:hypothetical protein [Halomonas korlensis]SFU88230.1 hypothetical protein SAMN04487955_11218 [Halomonas korlensis]